jgi:hypothetical protein
MLLVFLGRLYVVMIRFSSDLAILTLEVDSGGLPAAPSAPTRVQSLDWSTGLLA